MTAEVPQIAESTLPCGVCQRPAEVMATAPMCGQRPRYPLCWACFEDLNWSGYVEEVVPL